MNKNILHLMTGLVLSLAAATAFAAGPASPLPPDQAVFIERTRLLERDPFATDAREIRQWLLTWVTKAPEVKVTVCDILGPIPKQKIPYGSELLLQSMFGNAAFQLEHPELKADPQAVQVAGVESLVKAYAAILAAHPDARNDYFDQLAKLHSSGKLKPFLAPLIAAKCQKT